ncbi:MAG: hypothetical protein P9F75_10660 [Candidatus Contendobacter sp.]|nr:hypothetical protein [Candidatus Contendobacter sp.]
MKIYFSIPLLSMLWLLATPAQSAPPSADDFLPPVQASTPEQQQQLSQVQGPVQEVKDPATGQTAVQGQTAQDAINFVVNKRSAGAEPVKFGSGFGYVATGTGTYEIMENPTATRIAKRNAYVRAFLEAKKNLATVLGSMSSQGRNQLVEQMETITDAKKDLANFATTQDEKLEQAVQMLLKGFVTYAVEDDTAKKTVYVSIVTTPKTRGKFNRPSPNGMEADSIRDGLSQVLLEIQSGLVPPVGGKMIQVPATGEMAFVGFGSDVIRSSDNSALQQKMRLNAAKVADMRATDALVGLLIGDDTGWKSKMDESTQQAVKDFETSDTGKDASLQRFEKTRQSFLNVQKTSEQFQSLRSGVLPPGVTRKTFTSKDDAEVYAVAVYIPSVSRQAAQTAQEMSQAQLLDNPNEAGGTVPAPAAQDDNVPRPPKAVAPGPSGQVTRDKDL